MEQYFNTKTVDIILTVGIPLTIAVFIFAVNLFGLAKVASQVKRIWREFFPLVNEPTDPAIIALALVLRNYTAQQLVDFFTKYNDQIDPRTDARKYAERISQHIEQEMIRRGAGVKPSDEAIK